MERRNFLQMLGLFTGTTVLSSCGSNRDQKRLISYLVPPEEGVIPGEATWSLSTCQECPAGCGQLVRLRDGWPVKLEGLPGHPVNDGRLCLRGQSALARLYAPERIHTPLERHPDGTFTAIGWPQALARIQQQLALDRRNGGGAYLAGRTTGTLGKAIDAFCQHAGLERAAELEPLGHAALRQAYGILFAQPVLPRYDLANCDLLLTLGADLLESFVDPVGFAGQLAQAQERAAFHWIHLEPALSLTGANAAERRTMVPGSEPWLLAWLHAELLAGTPLRQLPEPWLRQLPQVDLATAAGATGQPVAELEHLANRLRQAKKPLLIVGGLATRHADGLQTALLAGLMQWCGGMIGDGVDFSRAQPWESVGDLRQLDSLAARLQSNPGLLLLSRTDPAGLLQADHPFLRALAAMPLRVGMGERLTASLRQCDLVLPLSHPLESWGDASPRRGLTGLLRPALAPQFDTRSEGEVLLALVDDQRSWQEALFEFWHQRFSEEQLQQLSTAGFVESAGTGPTVQLAPAAPAALSPLSPPAEVPLRLALLPSMRGGDGRSYSIPLLQEIPDPLTTISWGAWVAVSPALAAAHGLEDQDQLLLTSDGWQRTLPVKIQPGLPEGMLTGHLGLLDLPLPALSHGEPAGWLPLRQVTKSGARAPLPILAGSSSQQGRGLIPDPVHPQEKHGAHPSAYPEQEHPVYRWGMAIDLDRCIGCGACVAACYVENNVPIVGPQEHLRGREMSWLRIEPWYDAQGQVEFLPMLCQQCQKAPCEPVCPTYAAFHNHEGLNVQVYARCVGTRYCSNNCPYKVRRFNWFDHLPQGSMARMRNPDLAQRTKGVMEKCTFCLQRIRAAKDRADDEGRTVQDGEVTPACAQTCPSGAIVFGNLLDEKSAVSRLAHSERAYRVFDELGTDSSIHYLKPRPRA